MNELDKSTGELIPIEQAGQMARPVVAADWESAIRQAVAAKDARDKIITQILVPDTDYGTPAGKKLSEMTNEERKKAKPSLYKSGAEKIGDSFHLYPAYTIVSSIEDFDKPLFYFKYECRLTHRENGLIVGTGLGSCNSMEGKYRYRNAAKVCPECGKETIIKGKKDYGGGWLCFKAKGGCGAKWSDGDPIIESQEQGKVENDDIFTLINTVDKMAQKRAYVCAALNLGFSDAFTQDLEDIQRVDHRQEEVHNEPPPEPKPPKKPRQPYTVESLVKKAHEAENVEQLDKLTDWLDRRKDEYDTDERKPVRVAISIRKGILTPKPKAELKEVNSDQKPTITIKSEHIPEASEDDLSNLAPPEEQSPLFSTGDDTSQYLKGEH